MTIRIVVIGNEINEQKNIYVVSNDDVELDGLFIKSIRGVLGVRYVGHQHKKDFLDVVESLTDDYMDCDYKVIIDGEDVTSHF